MSEFTGYTPELERRDEIRDTATPFLVSRFDYDAPEEVDPRAWMRHDKQKDMSSCQGFSLTNCGENLYCIATQSKQPSQQFSQLFAYLESQRIDGLLGSDRGSTISGGLKVAETIGFLSLDALPYLTPYPRNARSLITSEMRQAAGAFKVGSHSWLESYEAIFNYLASGCGSVHTGTVWNNSFYAANGVLERISLVNGGGHATAWLGYSKRKDKQGRNYLWRLNSHNDSWTEIAPSVVDALCSHQYTSIVGISDLTTPGPRDMSWVKEKPFG